MCEGEHNGAVSSQFAQHVHPRHGHHVIQVAVNEVCERELFGVGLRAQSHGLAHVARRERMPGDSLVVEAQPRRHV